MAAMVEGAVVRQGHLRKLKTMKKKYFVLRAETSECSARLEYYESEKKFRSGAAPRRVLLLKSCYNITRRLDLKQKHVIALFTKEEQLCIVAENEQDLHAWLTAILKQFRTDDASDELLHPIQHVWQVNVQKKGLGASKNIQGLYNLCLTDKTLALVKIKSLNNVISDLGIPERVEYSLKNIRRCGDSECFFYMEVGRQTATGAGELWMHSDDSNIAQSMHSTIYHAMRNCAKETENEKDHIVISNKNLMEGSHPLPARRQTYSDGRGRAGFYNDKGLCVGSCIRQCVCAANTIDDSAAAVAPLTPLTHDSSSLRKRCDTMPTRASSGLDLERGGTLRDERDPLHSSLESSRDDIDSISEWYRTPRIPEEPDCCDVMSKDFMSMTTRGSSIAHSRTSSTCVEEAEVGSGSPALPEGYMPMGPIHDPLPLVSSSGSVCSGTPSTDPRFSEYQLEPATAHIAEERSTRAYSVGSRPAARAEPARLRAYSAGARRKPLPPATRPQHVPHTHTHSYPRASADDLMELDFSSNSPAPKVIVARTPPATGFMESSRRNVDEYVDMSPRNAGYVEMRPGEPPAASTPGPAAPATPDGYVEMTYGRAPTRPIAIGAPRQPPPAVGCGSGSGPGSPDERRRRREPRTPLGSQTLFHMSMESPSSPGEADDDDDDHHHLSTVRELVEPRAASPEPSSPQYVTLAANPRPDELRKLGGALHYASLDLEPRRTPAAPAPRLYTQIDFMRSEKYAADAT
ncbi:insulin receptor substrate 1 isoform X4 [Danaus plexippus]|uniref:insulin receptor substrate 1 isoform X4 n=1 Tax=Danaus plexippus TaxID=13037 RepID=UPI002AB28017|nr:insulin receptor substrate 1 isoform X4 [Danaus plexippus]